MNQLDHFPQGGTYCPPQKDEFISVPVTWFMSYTHAIINLLATSVESCGYPIQGIYEGARLQLTVECSC